MDSSRADLLKATAPQSSIVSSGSGLSDGSPASRNIYIIKTIVILDKIFSASNTLSKIFNVTTLENCVGRICDMHSSPSRITGNDNGNIFNDAGRINPHDKTHVIYLTQDNIGESRLYPFGQAVFPTGSISVPKRVDIDTIPGEKLRKIVQASMGVPYALRTDRGSSSCNEPWSRHCFR